MPVVGFLRSTSAAPFANLVTAFRKGLNEAGYVEDQNVAVEYRWAEGRHDRLPALVADLIRRKVDVFVGNNLAALAAKAPTTTVPIVFASGSDPVTDGLVASLNRPGGNVTGVSFTSGVLGPKRLELLRQLVPGAKTIAMLANRSTAETVTERSDVQAAALAIGQQLVVLDASSDQDIEAAFATFIQRGAGALLVGTGAFLNSHRVRIVALATRQALPVVYPLREYVEDGGLMSYGTSINDAYRQAGVYAGRILKGEKPGDLPVMQSTKFELVHQPQDRQDARHRNPANAARPRRRGHRMIRRRDLITLLGGAAVTWPLAARGQQPAMPVIGALHGVSASEWSHYIAGLRSGLSDAGLVEGRNLTIEFRWADGQFDRLPGLAADLVDRKVAVIVAGGSVVAVRAAMAATRTIPIVFTTAVDPVVTGLVASLNRPGGNATGITSSLTELEPKRLELLHELIPTAAKVALLVNPNNPGLAQAIIAGMQTAARRLALKIIVLSAGTEYEIEKALANPVDQRAVALVIGGDAYLLSRREQMSALALRHAIPTMFPLREGAVAGGLMSYGSNLRDMYRQAGVYVGRIIKGERPADLPVVQPTKFELVINLKTAKALGLTIPPTVLAIADEVIE